MSKKPTYIKCPRCSLNYILKKDKFCEICKKEMRAGGIEDDDLDLYDELDDLEICPVCKINYIQDGEIMCESCFEENEGIMPDKLWDKELEEEDDEDLDLLPPVDDQEDEVLVSAFAEDLDEDFADNIDEADVFEESEDVFEDDLDLDNFDDIALDDEDDEDDVDFEDYEDDDF